MRLSSVAIKSRVKVFIATVLYVLCDNFFQRNGCSSRGKTRVLVFHHIDDPKRFESIIRVLSVRYHVIDFKDYICGKKSNEKLNVIVALDDGYLSWYEEALKIFEKYKVKPLLFVSSGFIEISDENAKQFCLDCIKNMARTWVVLG